MKVNPTTKFLGRRLKTFSALRDSSIDWRMNSGGRPPAKVSPADWFRRREPAAFHRHSVNVGRSFDGRGGPLFRAMKMRPAKRWRSVQGVRLRPGG